MKALFLFLVLLLDHSTRAVEPVPVQTGKIKGSIIPVKMLNKWGNIGIASDGTWMPSKRDIAVVESHLQPFLQQLQLNPALIASVPGELPYRRRVIATKIGEILKKYTKYRRQYLGLIIQGKRHILLNSFPANGTFSYSTQFVFVSDGGSDFWTVIYSLGDDSFHELDINGEA